MVFIRQLSYHLLHGFRDVFFFGGGRGAYVRGSETVGTQKDIPSFRYRSSGVSGI